MSALERCAQSNRWPAPAKLNLCLYVIGKRADGYHELETLFQLIDYCDELSFTINSTGLIRRNYALGFDESSDLCLRAAHALRAASGTELGVEISLQKRIPMGGGLGGGSSDAATVLLALNHLWKANLNLDELAEIGLELGADVPLFVRGTSAWGSGIGEQLTPITMAPQKWLVITPQTPVSTAQIFSHNRLTPSPQMKKIRALKTALSQQVFDFAAAGNQLEPIVRQEFPRVEAVFEWYAQRNAAYFTGPARLSGTGGSVFAPLAEAGDHGTELLSSLPDDCSGFIATGLNTHPLHGASH